MFRGKLLSRSIYSKATAALLLVVALGATQVLAASPAQAAVIGVCTIKANDPHGSNHVTGNINSTGTVTCTVTMTEIFVWTTLERYDGATWRHGSTQVYGKNYAMNPAYTGCAQGPGRFRARVSYVLRAPAGYNPSYASGRVDGIWKNVSCGPQISAVPSDSATATPVDTGEEIVVQLYRDME